MIIGQNELLQMQIGAAQRRLNHTAPHWGQCLNWIE